MTAQEIISALRSASTDEIAQIRAVLSIPDAEYRRLNAEDFMPRDLGSLVRSKEPIGK